MRAQSAVMASLLCLVAILLAGCATFGEPESVGPGSPRIARLRFEPETVRPGEATLMSFYFEVGTADLAECVVVEQGVRQFQLYTSLQPITHSLREYSGVVAGTVEVPMRWSSEGIRSLEVHAVSKAGKTSNRLRATLTVR